jgi:hypothetical protein
MIFTAHQISFGDQIEKNAMGGACSRYWRQERCIEGFDGKI